MVIELLTNPGWGGLAFGLEFIGEKVGKKFPTDSLPSSAMKPWIILEASATSVLYPPALSPDIRQAMSQGKVFWLHAAESQAAELVHLILESGLVEGVLVRNLDHFAKSAPAAIWGRRWQLAAHKSGTDLVWLHDTAQPVIGFDVRLHWKARGAVEIQRGHGYFATSEVGNGIALPQVSATVLANEKRNSAVNTTGNSTGDWQHGSHSKQPAA